MKSVNLADAKARLRSLVDEALSGEIVQILRRGKPVVQITAITPPRKPIDSALFTAVTDGMEPESEDSGAFVRRMRDEARY